MKIITREQALKKGLSHYFTGKPCRNGHIDKRRTKWWDCIACHRDRRRASDKIHAKAKIARTNKRRANKLHATPSWADLDAIKEFYKNCPEGKSVDHIIPLQGKKVCGLHVLENLQYLCKKENSRKHNKFKPMIITSSGGTAK